MELISAWPDGQIMIYHRGDGNHHYNDHDNDDNVTFYTVNNDNGNANNDNTFCAEPCS